MNHESPQGLRCTFAEAEHNNLIAGIRMSTKAKVELFEEMLDFAWRSGAMEEICSATTPKCNQAHARTY